MAGIAVVGTGNMIRRLAGSQLAIVAAVATADHFPVIHPGYGRPGRGGVAAVTVVAGRDVP